MSIAIEVENLSKQYMLGKIGTGSMAHDINRWWHSVRGKEDPYLKIGETNDRTTTGNSEFVWSLQGINFNIEQGDAVGIIGRNGAGKSTLLKILSRVTAPTTGTVKAMGRIASLLEVGTGFHPELSGRENIYLNGAILGMRKTEIAQKFDEIVDFSGVERYIDTPVKRYSSGMYVRLAFAVASYLESEILIVDEVLAVGDAEFQKKCLGKMNDVSKGEGRTVLFVSHNMGAVSQLCNNAIVLHNGMLAYQGPVKQGLEFYLQSNSAETGAIYINEEPKASDFIEIEVLNEEGKRTTNFAYDEDVILKFTFQIEAHYVNAASLGLRIIDRFQRVVFTSHALLSDFIKTPGRHVMHVTIPKGVLVPNTYLPVIALHVGKVQLIKYLEAPVQFEIEETGTDFFQFAGTDYGCVFVDCKWEKS